jgi:hypothetical protein
MTESTKKPGSAGQELSKLGASKGGKARANVLTSEERSEIARNAVNARWMKAGKAKEVTADDTKMSDTASADGKTVSELPHSMFTGELTVGEVTFECHVLSDRQRVLTQREVVRVISGGRESGNLSRYLERLPNYSPDLLTGKTVQFQVPGSSTVANGYDAEILVEICELYLDARAANALHPRQVRLAKMAESVVRACAKVGIIALVDEATGYQKVRKQRDLQLKLQAFIADDMQEWARMFPDDFWFELARLEGIRYSPRNRPLRWGKYVMAFVYDAIDPEVGKELRKINPDPRHRRNHHQWLREFGRDKVNNQIQQVIAVMKLCDDMEEFKRKFARVFNQGEPYQMSFFD